MVRSSLSKCGCCYVPFQLFNEMFFRFFLLFRYVPNLSFEFFVLISLMFPIKKRGTWTVLPLCLTHTIEARGKWGFNSFESGTSVLMRKVSRMNGDPFIPDKRSRYFYAPRTRVSCAHSIILSSSSWLNDSLPVFHPPWRRNEEMRGWGIRERRGETSDRWWQTSLQRQTSNILGLLKTS